jgi:hypothetical protein
VTHHCLLSCLPTLIIFIVFAIYPFSPKISSTSMEQKRLEVKICCVFSGVTVVGRTAKYILFRRKINIHIQPPFVLRNWLTFLCTKSSCLIHRKILYNLDQLIACLLEQHTSQHNYDQIHSKSKEEMKVNTNSAVGRSFSNRVERDRRIERESESRGREFKSTKSSSIMSSSFHVPFQTCPTSEVQCEPQWT